MGKNVELGVYLKELEAVRSIFESSSTTTITTRFDTILSKLENYLLQIEAVETCELLLREPTTDIANLSNEPNNNARRWEDLDGLKLKLFFKLNAHVNECLRELEYILYVLPFLSFINVYNLILRNLKKKLNEEFWYFL